jgi:16S rRNA (adenine1518-N6/adenine1519-N6)-dimethyltransferase
MDNKLTSPSQAVKFLNQLGLHLSKLKGQHLLVDENILAKIVEVADISGNDLVLEVGAGLGGLTTHLAAKAKAVVTVEIDKQLVLALKRILANFGNIKLVAKDAMKLRVEDLSFFDCLPNKLVSNLPYKIAAPLLLKLLEDFPFIEEYVVMVQREIAERILAKPARKNYGAYTLKLKYFAQSQALFSVSRNVFLPPPNVDSSVIKLKRKNKQVFTDKTNLFQLINASFSQRRKTLLNALSSQLGISKKDITLALSKLGIDFKTRAERLTLDDFCQLARELDFKSS